MNNNYTNFEFKIQHIHIYHGYKCQYKIYSYGLLHYKSSIKCTFPKRYNSFILTEKKKKETLYGRILCMIMDDFFRYWSYKIEDPYSKAHS